MKSFSDDESSSCTIGSIELTDSPEFSDSEPFDEEDFDYCDIFNINDYEEYDDCDKVRTLLIIYRHWTNRK